MASNTCTSRSDSHLQPTIDEEDLEQSFDEDVVHMMGALSFYGDDDDDTIRSHSVSLCSPNDEPFAWLVLKENMFSYLNHFTGKFDMQTEGSIEVWMKSASSAFEFDFDLEDGEDSIMNFQGMTSQIVHISKNNQGTDKMGSRYVCKVSVPSKAQDSSENRKIHIANYKCYSRGPISPVQLRTNVSNAGNYCRIAIVISKCTQSKCVSSLKGFVIILYVPLDLDVESVTMPLPQGEWNELRRIITWRVSFPPEEERLKVLAQFKLKNDELADPIDYNTVEFPVMVSCFGNSNSNEVPSGIVLKISKRPSTFSVKNRSEFQFTHRIK